MLALTVGFAISVPVTAYLFQKPIEHAFRDEYAARSGLIADVYARLAPSERDAYLERLAKTQGLAVWIYDSGGLRHAYGEAGPSALTGEEIRNVLNGADQVKRTSALPLPTSLSFGYPIVTAEGPAALVLHPDRSGLDLLFLLVGAFILIALAIGSFKFILFTRLVVRPLKALTAATRKVARGDYNIELRTKSKDELGVLSEQFRQMAHEISQVEKMRQEFVSNVSHEIQTPLASISGYVSILQNNDLDEAEQLRCLNIIRQESVRLSRLSENMLRLASIDSNQYPFHPTLVRLDRQLRRVVVAAEPQWAAKRLNIRLELPKAAIRADEDLLTQVWLNLFGNSIKFTPEGGEIFIELYNRKNEVGVVIRDTGIGIAEEDRKRVFERFYMADKSHNRQAGGSGLGLAIVKRVVELHRGSVEIQSAVGQGTAVTVLLPAM
jgi:signal transduction histidine kinase